MTQLFRFTSSDIVIFAIEAIMLMAAIILVFAARKYPEIFWRWKDICSQGVGIDLMPFLLVKMV